MYRALSLLVWLMFWLRTWCHVPFFLQVQRRDGAITPLPFTYQQLWTDSVQPHVPKAHHNGEDQGARGVWMRVVIRVQVLEVARFQWHACCALVKSRAYTLIRETSKKPTIWLQLTHVFILHFNDLITHCMENNPSLDLTTTSLQNPKLFP